MKGTTGLLAGFSGPKTTVHRSHPRRLRSSPRPPLYARVHKRRLHPLDIPYQVDTTCLRSSWSLVKTSFKNLKPMVKFNYKFYSLEDGSVTHSYKHARFSRNPHPFFRLICVDSPCRGWLPDSTDRTRII